MIVDGVERDSRNVAPRELVGNYIVFSADVMHVGGKLADEGQVASLTRKTLSNTGEGKSEGLMISEDIELAALNVAVKVLDHKEDGQLFAIQSPVLFSVLESFQEKKYTQCQIPLRNCSSWPSTALSEASTEMLVLASR